MTTITSIPALVCRLFLLLPWVGDLNLLKGQYNISYNMYHTSIMGIGTINPLLTIDAYLRHKNVMLFLGIYGHSRALRSSANDSGHTQGCSEKHRSAFGPPTPQICGAKIVAHAQFY